MKSKEFIIKQKGSNKLSISRASSEYGRHITIVISGYNFASFTMSHKDAADFVKFISTIYEE